MTTASHVDTAGEIARLQAQVAALKAQSATAAQILRQARLERIIGRERVRKMILAYEAAEAAGRDPHAVLI